MSKEPLVLAISPMRRQRSPVSAPLQVDTCVPFALRWEARRALMSESEKRYA